MPVDLWWAESGLTLSSPCSRWIHWGFGTEGVCEPRGWRQMEHCSRPVEQTFLPDDGEHWSFTLCQLVLCWALCITSVHFKHQCSHVDMILPISQVRKWRLRQWVLGFKSTWVQLQSQGTSPLHYTVLHPQLIQKWSQRLFPRALHCAGPSVMHRGSPPRRALQLARTVSH